MTSYWEALLLDPQGYVAEGVGENLVLVVDGKVRTTAPIVLT